MRRLSAGTSMMGLPARQRVGRTFAVGLAIFVFALMGCDFASVAIAPEVWWGFAVWIAASALFAVVTGGVLVYVTRRLLQAALTVFVIATLTFLLMRFLPGGPFDAEKTLPADIKANIEAKYGLNLPLSTQYINYLSKLAHGEFGESYKYIGRDVGDIVRETLPISAQLGVYALMLAFIVGIPLGVLAAAKHNSWIDSGVMMVAMSGVALPSFMVGPLLVMIFSFGIPFAAFQGLLPPALWESPVYYILPVVTLGLRPAAIIARMTRASMLDVIRADFVRTARAKGVSAFRVLFQHVLKNSLIPVITIAGPLAADLLSGAFVIEIVFGVPGMGKHLVQSVTNRDYPLVLGLTLVFSCLLVIANLLVDLMYTVVDPRIKLS